MPSMFEIIILFLCELIMHPYVIIIGVVALLFFLMDGEI